jgi:antitoxin MazE7
MQALSYGTMATETATIRVSRETRDLLAEQARKRGIPLAALLGEIARHADREAVFRAEREASRRDAGESSVRAEEREWAGVLGDDID